MINTYVYFDSDTLRIHYGYFTNKFESFIVNTDYVILECISDKKDMISFTCHAINEDGIPYYLRIDAVDMESASRYFNTLYPNDNLLEVQKTVYTTKPMMY